MNFCKLFITSFIPLFIHSLNNEKKYIRYYIVRVGDTKWSNFYLVDMQKVSLSWTSITPFHFWLHVWALIEYLFLRIWLLLVTSQVSTAQFHMVASGPRSWHCHTSFMAKPWWDKEEEIRDSKHEKDSTHHLRPDSKMDSGPDSQQGNMGLSPTDPCQPEWAWMWFLPSLQTRLRLADTSISACDILSTHCPWPTQPGAVGPAAPTGPWAKEQCFKLLSWRSLIMQP